LAAENIAAQRFWSHDPSLNPSINADGAQWTAQATHGRAPWGLLDCWPSDQVATPSGFQWDNQPEVDANPSILHDKQDMVPPVTDTSDSEARSLLAGYFGEYINPDSTEYIPRISSHLEGITIERQDGELIRNIKKLFEPSSLNTTFQLVRFSVYLSSNNLLSNHHTDKLLQWTIRTERVGSLSVCSK